MPDKKKRVRPRVKDDLKIPRRKVSKKQLKRKERVWTVGLVVVVAIAVKFVLNYINGHTSLSSSSGGPTNTMVHQFMTSLVCRHKSGFCHGSLEPVRRTHQARKDIPGGEKLLVIPRELQIWDLDAFRDPYIHTLLGATHPGTLNPIHSLAYLSVYLLRRFVLKPKKNDPLLPYYKILPSYADLQEDFPVLWDAERLTKFLETHTASFATVRAFQDMLRSEYEGFAEFSTTFAQEVSETDYKRMRVLVLSRSFGTGPPGPEESLPDKDLAEELQEYQEATGNDLSEGCGAMVPVLDMYNHHPKHNVEYEYSKTERAFVVKAAEGGIPANHEIYDNYGKYSDSHLLARYGFQNGDGSGYTQVSLASLHRLLDVGLKEFSYVPYDEETKQNLVKGQKYVLGRYLQFDEGYSYCIESSTKTPMAWTLKTLKLQHLLRIANSPERWLVNLKPRNDTSVPAPSSDQPITSKAPTYDFEQLQIQAGKMLELCRLIALTWEDFEGEAVKVLREALETSPDDAIVVEKQTDGLEYRAVMCIHRLTALSLHRSGSPDLVEEGKYLERLTGRAFASPRWNAKHVRYGELQGLELVSEQAQAAGHELGLRITEGNISKIPYIQPIRMSPCDWNLTEALVNETEYV